MKPYRFFFHFNKPATLKAGKAQISVHYKDACHIVDNVSVAVPTRGRINKRQPKFVMIGDAHNLEIKNGVAHLF